MWRPGDLVGGHRKKSLHLYFLCPQVRRLLLKFQAILLLHKRGLKEAYFYRKGEARMRSCV